MRGICWPTRGRHEGSWFRPHLAGGSRRLKTVLLGPVSKLPGRPTTIAVVPDQLFHHCSRACSDDDRIVVASAWKPTPWRRCNWQGGRRYPRVALQSHSALPDISLSSEGVEPPRTITADPEEGRRQPLT
jgi:hypothetical protein